MSHCWSSFQLYLHLWSCGPFSWIIAGDRIQCLLPFGAFFTFTTSLTLLERAGNHSSPEKYPPKYQPVSQESYDICTSTTSGLHLQPLYWVLVQHMTKVISSRMGAKIRGETSARDKMPWSALPHAGSPGTAKATWKKVEKAFPALCICDKNRHQGRDSLGRAPWTLQTHCTALWRWKANPSTKAKGSTRTQSTSI